MGSHGKAARWFPNLSHNHRSSSSSASRNPRPVTPPPTDVAASVEIPREFVCPISGRLMADPVIIVTGHTYERSCIQACKDLRVVPPGAGEVSAADLLIPNLALRAAIFNWCGSRGLDPPQAVDPSTAKLFVRDLPQRGRRSPKTSIDLSPQIFHSPTNSSSNVATTTSSSSSDIPPSDQILPSPGSGLSHPLGREILTGLKAPQISEQEEAVRFLRSSTRDGSGDNRVALCDEKILAALRPMILSRYPSLCLHAVASLVNLSLHPPNRVRINSAVPEAQDHAAAVLFSLSVEDDNKAAIGVLGALPPLLHLLCRNQAEERTRRDAGMALYHLSMAGTNLSKLVKQGAIKSLLALAAAPPAEAHSLPGLALMIVCNLASGGAVPALARLLRAVPPAAAAGRDSEVELKKEYCVAALYSMTQAAGLEEVLRAVDQEEDAAALAEEEDGEAGAPERAKKRRFREMVKRTLRATCGIAAGDDDDGGSSSCGSGDTPGSQAFGTYSEPILRMHSSSVNAHAHGSNTTQF
ncbi:unnamed protein product [Spirodela intermedia]|uniref:RING-type E3 ubiquitin transferase n=1 Tax=Spirodela intermedia TaxID=51605 RepID=A0A7I8JKD4_SPIIN|nr:unnamed protein product [Spirodela intermedia]CAA6670608.1 unnamed protein product [Spirodela intermedia]